MAINTDGTIEEFGTKDPLDDTTTSAVSDANMSVQADAAEWTNTDDAAEIQLVLMFQHASGAISGSINVHVRPIEVDGTNDTSIPTTADQLGYAGSFLMDASQATATDTFYTAKIPLTPFSTKTQQKYEFYLFNDSGQAMSANWDLDGVPKAYNGAA